MYFKLFCVAVIQIGLVNNALYNDLPFNSTMETGFETLVRSYIGQKTSGNGSDVLGVTALVRGDCTVCFVELRY